MLNPNWPEVHEEKHAPVIGQGAVLFPYTGSEGKDGGNQANAALVREAGRANRGSISYLPHSSIGLRDAFRKHTLQATQRPAGCSCRTAGYEVSHRLSLR